MSSPNPRKFQEPSRPHKSLEEIVAGFWENIPEEERKRFPWDGSIQHDHYIYGWPKRTEP